MGEIRFVGTGETRGYPYPVCKKKLLYHGRSDTIIIIITLSRYANIHYHSKIATLSARTLLYIEGMLVFLAS